MNAASRGQSPSSCSVLADLLLGVLAGPAGACEEEDVSEVGELVGTGPHTATWVLVDELVVVAEHVRVERSGDDRDAARLLLPDDRETGNVDFHDRPPVNWGDCPATP